MNTPFSISYGSGAARGNLGQDSVQFAGFEVSDQAFGVITHISTNLLTSAVSGLMGLGFKSISYSGATPLWQALAESSGTLDQPLMAFQLTRFAAVQNAQVLEPGGTFNLGTVNTLLYTGDIDSQPIPEGQEGYWIQELAGLTVNGQSLSLDAGSASYAAIDTGTLVGAADSIACLIWAPGRDPTLPSAPPPASRAPFRHRSAGDSPALQIAAQGHLSLP